MTTLARKYADKQADILLETRARHLAGSEPLAEGYAQILVEALDKNEMQQANAILTKLGKISAAAKSAGMSYIPSVIEKAAKDVRDFTGGGLKALATKGLSALQQKLGAKAGSNPVLKSVVLANSLEAGFDVLGDVLQNQLDNYDSSGDGKLDDLEDQATKSKVKGLLSKAFEPEGMFAKIQSLFGSGIPYVDKTDMIVQDIMSCPANKLTAVTNAVKSGIGTDQVQQVAKDMVTAAKNNKETGEGNTPQKKGEVISSPQDLARDAAAARAQAAGEDPKKASAQAASNPKQSMQDLMSDVGKRSGVDPKIVGQILKVLVARNRLKFNMQTESVKITMDDIVEAQYTLLESNGSSKRWLRRLLERQANSEQTIVDAIAAGKSPEEAAKSADQDISSIDWNAINDAIENKELEAERQKNKDVVANLKRGQQELARLLDKVSAEKDEAEAGKALSDEKVSNLSKQLEDDTKKMQQFVAAIAKQFGDTPDAQKQFQDAMQEKGIEGALEALNAKHGEELAAAVAKAKIDLAGKTNDRGGKHDKLIADLESELKGIDSKTIASVLDALPDYLVAEARRNWATQQIRSILF
jgi:hypothetical protein